MRNKLDPWVSGTSERMLGLNLNVGALALLVVTLPPQEQDLTGNGANTEAVSWGGTKAKPGPDDIIYTLQLQSLLYLLKLV